MIGVPKVSRTEMSLFAPARDPIVAELIDRLRADNRMIYAQIDAENDREILTRLRARRLVAALKKVIEC